MYELSSEDEDMAFNLGGASQSRITPSGFDMEMSSPRELKKVASARHSQSDASLGAQTSRSIKQLQKRLNHLNNHPQSQGRQSSRKIWIKITESKKLQSKSVKNC